MVLPVFSLALFALVIQFITGIFLTFWYIPNILEAFNSVEFIMRKVRQGWFLRYLHANGGLLSSTLAFTEERKWTWLSGLLILLAMIFTDFLGDK